MVEDAKVTSAIWGTFDQFIITGHEDGTVAKYDILKVKSVGRGGGGGEKGREARRRLGGKVKSGG